MSLPQTTTPDNVVLKAQSSRVIVIWGHHDAKGCQSLDKRFWEPLKQEFLILSGSRVEHRRAEMFVWPGAYMRTISNLLQKSFVSDKRDRHGCPLKFWVPA